MNLICTGNKEKKDFYKYLLNIVNHVSSFPGVEITIDEFVADDSLPGNIKVDALLNVENKYDFVICLGGDGALISAIRRMGENQLPILGIHIGTLGFLNTATKDNYLDGIEYVIKNNQSIKTSRKSLISVTFTNINSDIVNFYALNEIYINQSNVSRLLELKVLVDKVKLNNYKCDGLIIATPTGSTAYSLSAGGPILNSNVNGYIITPVSPFSLSSRSIVLNDSSKIEVVCNDNSNDITIYADGQQSDTLLSGSTVTISKSKIYAKIIRTPFDTHYFDRLRKQLGWSK
tara:strand:+ start:1558 stop:2424 length:867 start_codon:yes stop_codon:yes gene_type:complete